MAPRKRIYRPGYRDRHPDHYLRSIGKRFISLHLILAILVALSLTVHYGISRSRSRDLLSPSRRVAPLGHRISTPGCTIAKYDPFHPSVRQHFEKADEYRCPGKPNFIKVRDESPYVDTVALAAHGVQIKDLLCTYHEIYMNLSLAVPDNSFFFGPETKLNFGCRLDKEFVISSCTTSTDPGMVFHSQFLLNPILKTEVEARCRGADAIPGRRPSVLVLGVDSVSYLNFNRHLPMTAGFVRNRLEAFELHGYNKVGDNSIPNQFPLLLGLTETEVMNATVDNFADNADIIWKHYAQRGYRTMFLEEMPDYGIFNVNHKGFHKPPADYYLRPVIKAIEKSALRKVPTPAISCVGAVVPTEIYLDYLLNFIHNMKYRPFFVYHIVAEMSHEKLNYAGYTDALLKRLFDKMERNGHLDRTVVVFLSDHGMRYGPIRTTFIGKYEDRQPFAFLAFPRSFLDAYPDVERNLKTNERRLTTPFDIHATLVELLGFPYGKLPKTKHGISLFREVPDIRTCAEASIPHQWCTCESTESDISPDDPTAVLMAEAFVGEMNQWLQRETRLCHPMTLRNVLDTTAVQRSGQDRKQNVRCYWVMVEVSPSGGIFEGTVCGNGSGSTFSIGHEVTRCNRHYLQSYCMGDHWLQQFCFCRRNYGIEM